MIQIKVMSLEWFDTMSIKDNIIYRNTNNDRGTFTINDNKLIIDWDVWGKEIFICRDNNEYYKEHYTTFTIGIETGSYYDDAELNIENKTINLKNEIKKGKYKFINNTLEVIWDNNIKELFYMYNYGKNFYSMKKSSNECLTKKVIKNVAIIFPQFHETPENNKFWGDGFTEWTLLKDMPESIVKQRIKKPHDDIGYYNLKDVSHRKYMEKIANHHEIHSFCYYHYWFKNKKIMYEPLEMMLKDGHPNLPFMFCWANEQWTRKWDGGNNEILIEQDYDDEKGNKNHFKYLLNFFKHDNYIKIKNKPVFIFYRIEKKDVTSLENIITTWNKYAIENGFSGIHFMRFLGPFDNNISINGIEGYVNFEPGYSSQKYGNDIISYDKDNLIFNDYNEKSYLDKNPDISEMINKKIISSGLLHYKNLGEKEKLIRTSKFNVYDGSIILDKIKNNKIENINQHLGIFVGWNNTPRRNYTNQKYNTYPMYYKDIDENKFSETYKEVLNNTNISTKNKMNFIFITSWNEWNEQSSLEPNDYDGYNYLSEVKKTYYNFYRFAKKKNILIFSHKGGGTEKYINDLKDMYIDYNFIFYDEKINISNYDNIDLIHINSFFTLNISDNYTIFFKNNFKNIPKIITIHDYQWIYPDEPNILSYSLSKKNYDKNDINNFLSFCTNCDKIIFPSYNILKNYNELMDLNCIKSKIIVTPHIDKHICYDNLYISDIKEYINIAFIGNFIKYKGCELYKYLFNNVKYYNGKLLKYHIFGYLSDDEKNNKIIDDNFIYHNGYEEKELIQLLYKNNIHIITHLSLFEESYCYALSNSINSGIPILYINHGSLTERLGDKKIIKDRFFPSSVNDLIKKFQKILVFIEINKNTTKIINTNDKLQPNKWYLTNY